MEQYAAEQRVDLRAIELDMLSQPSCDAAAEVVKAVSDRVRAELLRRIGLGDLLIPRDLAASH
jgi:hypothetical protein